MSCDCLLYMVWQWCCAPCATYNTEMKSHNMTFWTIVVCYMFSGKHSLLWRKHCHAYCIWLSLGYMQICCYAQCYPVREMWKLHTKKRKKVIFSILLLVDFTSQWAHVYYWVWMYSYYAVPCCSVEQCCRPFLVVKFFCQIIKFHFDSQNFSHLSA